MLLASNAPVLGRWHGLLAMTAFSQWALRAGNSRACSAALGFNRRAGGEYFGLIERSFYLWMTAWFCAVAILLTLRTEG